MTKPQKPSEDDEICLMCRRPKSRHTPEEMLACSRKMKEFQKEKSGGVLELYELGFVNSLYQMLNP